MTTWFTSDTHFNHANIIKYCNRPFKTVEEMNEKIISNWNAVVLRGDYVFHLGDVALGSRKDWPNFVGRLNGVKHLVRGNHDGSRKTMLECGFNYVDEEVEFKGWKLVHNPIGMTGKVLCGHVHEKWVLHSSPPDTVIINVGQDQWDFAPVSLDRILTRFPLDKV